MPALLTTLLTSLVLRTMYALGAHTLDDAYITFRYARNLARGFGFVFNPGERVLGTTTPLFAILLVPFHLSGLDIILFAQVINVLASTASVLFVFFIVRREFGPWIGLIAAMLLAISTSTVRAASTGMETELNVLLLVVTIAAYLCKRYDLAACVATIAVLMRFDDIILVAIIFGWHIFKARRTRQDLRHVLRPLGIFVLCLSPWLVFSTLYFGSPVPNSLFAKAASVRVPVNDNLVLYFEQFGFNLNTPRSVASTLLFLLGAIRIFRMRKDTIIVPAYFLSYSLIFVFTGVRLGSGWYWQPLWPAFCFVFAAGVWYSVDSFAQNNNLWQFRSSRTKSLILTSTVLVIVLVWAGSLKARFLDIPPPRDETTLTHEQAGRWLSQNTPETATIALQSIGAVGWYSDRYILDEVGIVSPEVAKLNSQQGILDSFQVINKFQPDYYLAFESEERQAIVSTEQKREWFNNHYYYLRSFDFESKSVLALFKKYD